MCLGALITTVLNLAQTQIRFHTLEQPGLASPSENLRQNKVKELFLCVFCTSFFITRDYTTTLVTLAFFTSFHFDFCLLTITLTITTPFDVWIMQAELPTHIIVE